MCEPAHSVVQYPHDFDDTDLPFGGQMDKESRLKSALGKACGWTKKIGKWFHLSRFGAGHSKATLVDGRQSLYLPKATLYEGYWWDRKFSLDGLPDWKAKEDPLALKAAQQYHNDSVMGNMSLFRRFLETSMRKTSHPLGASTYVHTLINSVLTTEGGNKLLARFRRVFGGKSFRFETVMGPYANEVDINRSIKLVMGFTRQRRLFLPHFSDDNSLWVPGGKVGE